MEREEYIQRRECWTWGGWNLGRDDDTPCIPDPGPLGSGQAKRAWRSAIQHHHSATKKVA